MIHLVPCPGCQRHVRTLEPSCPFCGVELSLANTPAPVLPSRRLGRAATFAFGATLLAANAAGGCGAESVNGGPPGDDGGTTTATGGASSGGYSGNAGTLIYGGPPVGGMSTGGNGAVGGTSTGGDGAVGGTTSTGGQAGDAGGGGDAGDGGMGGFAGDDGGSMPEYGGAPSQ